MSLKFWHVVVMVAVITVCLWAQNHIPAYGKLTA